MPAKANLHVQKAEPLRCLALRSKGDQLKKINKTKLPKGGWDAYLRWLMDMGSKYSIHVT